MNLSIATDFRGSGGDPEDVLVRIAAAGFTHLHWCHQWHTDHFYTDREIARIGTILRREGLRLLDIHGSDGSAGGFICCWYSPVEEYRRAGVELVLNRLRMLAMLRGEGTLMMHVPFFRTDTREADRADVLRKADALRRSLDELVPVCHGLGLSIALENMAGDTFEILAAMFREYPADAVGLCFDSGHGNIDVPDPSAGGPAHHGLDHLEEHLDRLLALHLHDNDSSGDQHQPPFYGNLDWKRLMTDIRKSPYKGPFSFELSIGNTPFGATVDSDGFLRDAYERCARAAKSGER